MNKHHWENGSCIYSSTSDIQSRYFQFMNSNLGLSWSASRKRLRVLVSFKIEQRKRLKLCWTLKEFEGVNERHWSNKKAAANWRSKKYLNFWVLPYLRVGCLSFLKRMITRFVFHTKVLFNSFRMQNSLSKV